MRTLGPITGLLALALLLPAPAAAAERAGNVVSVRGKAVIEREARRTAARVKADLLATDIVRTEERSRVKMLFRNDSVITLGASSKLVVRQYLDHPDPKRTQSVYELADGKLRAVVGSGGFKVVTPTAYAAARGTVFIVWYDLATNTTGIAVIEGGVEIGNIRRGDEQAVILTAGQMSVIMGLELPTPPQPFSLDIWGPGAEQPVPGGIVPPGLNDIKEPEVEVSIEGNGTVLPEIVGLQEDIGTPAGEDPPIPIVTPIDPPIDQQPAQPTPVSITPLFRE